MSRELVIERFQLCSQTFGEIVGGWFLNLVFKLLEASAKASDRGSNNASLPLIRNSACIGFQAWLIDRRQNNMCVGGFAVDCCSDRPIPPLHHGV